MRLRVKVLEGDDKREHVVSLATVLAYRKEHGETVNETIRNQPLNDTEWGAWLAWHSEMRAGDGRDFDEWSGDVEWVRVDQAPDVLDPSGGEDIQTNGSSPASSSPAPSKRSSSSTSRSKRPSGSKRAAA